MARRVAEPDSAGHKSFAPCRTNDPCPCGSGKKAKKCCLAN
ncbi:SEC-C metal-binding domain-containing protein [Mesorhizobium sp.]|nr:SEC-C metal-binding domain-containing protein [Mesorhizobium sp.]RWP38089.1 MAG: hypothetical protein EOR03_03680 [Mesorhizobium sp.]